MYLKQHMYMYITHYTQEAAVLVGGKMLNEFAYLLLQVPMMLAIVLSVVFLSTMKAYIL